MRNKRLKRSICHNSHQMSILAEFSVAEHTNLNPPRFLKNSLSRLNSGFQVSVKISNRLKAKLLLRIPVRF